VEGARYRPVEYATPLVIGHVAFVGHSGRAFEAVDLRRDRRLWQVPTRGRIYTTAAYAGGLLIFGDDEGEIRAVTLSGEEAWKFPNQYPAVTSPVAAEGRVFLAVADQNVFCLEAGTGRPLWQYGRKFPRRNALWRALGLAYGDGKVYAGFSDGTVVALDAEVGRVVWRAEVGGTEVFGDVTAGPSFRDARVYAGAFRGPTVCLEAESGEVVWRRDLAVAAGFAVGDELVYAATANGTIAALARADGDLIWEVQLKGGILTPPVLAGATVVVGEPEGSIIGLDAYTGERIGQYEPGPGLRAQPLIFEGGALFLSNGSALHWIH
jgi:outer membrane protein assembly factor BamB